MLGDPGDDVLLGFAQPVRGVDAVEAGQHELEVDARCADASARHPGGHPSGDAAVDVGFAGVVEAQLHAGADAVAQGGTDVVPAPGGEHQVHSGAQAARGDLVDRGFGALELCAQCTPVVDHQEDVRGVEVSEGLDALGAHRAFPFDDQCAHLGEGAAHQVGFGTTGDGADVRCRRVRVKCPAAEVDAVEPHLLGGVGEHSGEHDRAQE